VDDRVAIKVRVKAVSLTALLVTDETFDSWVVFRDILPGSEIDEHSDYKAEGILLVSRETATRMGMG
jgi:hypothetical protein